MTRARRTASPIKVAVSEQEKATLRRYAGGRPLAVYLRRLALGSRPGAVESADDWWASMTPGQREGIYQWLGAAKHRGHAGVLPGQMTMFEDDATQG